MNLNNNSHEKDCFCITKRAMSLISAALLFVFFLVFMTGYVWGKRVALEDVLKAIEQKTFADQISGSLYSLACTSLDAKKELSKESSHDSVIMHVVENKIDALPSEDSSLQGQAVEGTEGIDKDKALIALEKENSCSALSYYAQLVGFGSKQAANQFIDRLKCAGFEVAVKERMSTNAQGKKRFWYQVVTQRYTNKEELERVVAHITKKEHLSGVHIVAC